MKLNRLKRWFELPLLAKELNEQAAQRRTYVFRFLYGAVLFAAACGIFYGSFLKGGDSSSGLGQGRYMFEKLVHLQFWTIFLFLPAVSCGCLTLEKERNTLGLLLITALSPGQIILQKLLGRLIPMLTFVVLSFPLMAVAYSFGGFTEDHLWAGIVLLIVSCIQAAALSLLCSAWYATTVEAFIANYVLFIVLYFALPFCWGPWLFEESVNGRLAHTMIRLIFPGMMTAAFLIAARMILPARAFVPPRNVLLQLFQKLDAFFNEANSVTGGVVLVKDGDPLPNFEPIAWRETTKKSLGTFRYLFRVLVALEAPLIIVGFSMQTVMPGGPDVRIVQRLLYVLWCLGGAMIIVHAASVIASERTRQTLDVLLTTPLTGERILREKLRGVQRLIKVLVIPFVTTFVFEAWWNNGNQYRLLQLALSVATLSYLPTLKWLALWIGLKMRSQMRAVLTTIACVVTWLLVPDILRAVIVEMAGRAVPGWLEVFLALNPFTQILAIEDLSLSMRLASTKAIREGFWPFLWLTIANFGIYAAAGYYLRRRVLNHADRLLGRLEPPAKIDHPPTSTPAFEEEPPLTPAEVT